MTDDIRRSKIDIVYVAPLGMSLPILRFSVYAIAALAGAVLLSLLRNRFKQRGLQKIQGPSNPSLIWGKLYLGQSKADRILKWILWRSFARYFQSQCLSVP